MPADVTIFAAKYLVFVEAVLAAVLVAYLLYRRSAITLVRWAVATCVMLLVAFIAAQIAGAVYNDPRPFVEGHYTPLIAHAPDNGFPSDHSLMAAALVASVAFIRWWWALVLVPIAVAVEWARVGAGIHHPIDVLGSDGCVAIATVIAVVVARRAAPRIRPYVPNRLLDLVASREEGRA